VSITLKKIIFGLTFTEPGVAFFKLINDDARNKLAYKKAKIIPLNKLGTNTTPNYSSQGQAKIFLNLLILILSYIYLASCISSNKQNREFPLPAK